MSFNIRLPKPTRYFTPNKNQLLYVGLIDEHYIIEISDLRMMSYDHRTQRAVEFIYEHAKYFLLFDELEPGIQSWILSRFM